MSSVQNFRAKARALHNYSKRTILPNLKKGNLKKPSKIVYHKIRSKINKDPYVLIVETGTTCNIRCPTCPTPRDVVLKNRAPGNMEFKNFKKIIDNTHKSFSHVLLYWTNEPLLNKHLEEMIEYCHEKKLYTQVSTNVMLLTEKRAKSIIESGLDDLIVCMDGFSAKTFESFRRGAKFDIVKRNIERIVRLKKEMKVSKPWIELQYIENKENTYEVEECKKWAEEIGVDNFHLKSLAVVEHIKDHDKMKERFHSDSLKKNRYKKEETGKKKECPLPKNQVAVVLTGHATLCCYDIEGKEIFGNLLLKSFEDIKKTKKYQEIKRKGLNFELGICQNCSVYLGE